MTSFWVLLKMIIINNLSRSFMIMFSFIYEFKIFFNCILPKSNPKFLTSKKEVFGINNISLLSTAFIRRSFMTMYFMAFCWALLEFNRFEKNVLWISTKTQKKIFWYLSNYLELIDRYMPIGVFDIVYIVFNGSISNRSTYRTFFLCVIKLF